MANTGYFLSIFILLYTLNEWTKCAAAVIPLDETDHTGVWNYLTYELPRQMDKSDFVDDPFLRIEKAPSPVTIVRRGDTVTLECQAIGIPPPVITWRKDGKRVKQAEGDEETNAFEKLTNIGSRTVQSSTSAGRLRLDCVDASMAGVYQCVAENGYETITSDGTELVVLPVDSHSPSTPLTPLTPLTPDTCSIDRTAVSPTIVMFTEFRFENEGNNVQLFCRASGYPKPEITWLDIDERPVEMNDDRYVLPNGDLFIRNVQGYAQYFCVASNVAGRDKVDTFIYATA